MKKILFLLSILLLSVPPTDAKVKLPSVIGNNMVLQQQTCVRLWGSAEPNRKVVVQASWDRKKYTSQSDSSGKFMLSVNTPKAGGPFSITISDGEALVISNVLIGEVWFCSGQSNMEMPVKGFDRQPVEGCADVIIHARPTVPLRMFTTERKKSIQPMDDCSGSWGENTPEIVARTSATAYFFARYIQEVLGVPVGIIVSSWGGSRVEPWMTPESIEPFRKTDAGNLPGDCSQMYHAMVAPIIHYTIKGMLWYQGESNRNNPELYGRLMQSFVKGLRKVWGLGDIPFYYVQIAPYIYEGADGKSAAYLREAQLKNMTQIPNCGMVSLMDIGALTCIHPPKKQLVGKRLAYWALAKTYGRNGFGFSGPVYRSMEVKENKVYLSFDYAQEGVAPLEQELDGFEVAGEDKVFYPARAIVEAKSGRLGVVSDSVLHPVAVRYGFKNYFVGSLFDVYGNPASSFRTDNW